MDNQIGYKTTFWELVSKQSISIPTLQRDYIYGAGTEKTKTVLSNMLSTFKTALDSVTQDPNDRKEETLDFVYGSDSIAKDFMPLDGQQRLTTLFLLHYYAALISPDATEEDFATLARFSYATRNCTVAFCKQILFAKHKDLANEISMNGTGEKVISEYLENLDEFRGSFYADPSIISMLVVLDRIHATFGHQTYLWDKLTSCDCPINFYILDFGRFDLSDDLYNKMNSRGKPLTSFEIVKAKIHKLIRKINIDKANKIAIKFDTTWMQFIWEALDYTPDLKAVDPSYMNMLRAIFVGFDYISGYDKPKYKDISDECLAHHLSSAIRVRSMEMVLDILSACHQNIPDELKADFNESLSSAIKGDMHAGDYIRLYSYFLGLYLNLDNEEFVIRERHLRNLIANSADQTREERLTDLLNDTSRLMHGQLLKFSKAKGFNSLSWNEEQQKESSRDVWRSLYQYEDVSEINGTLQAFTIGLNDDGKLDLNNSSFVQSLKNRLGKAKHFFVSSANEKLREEQKRSALLSLGDYSMCRLNHEGYRYYGVINGSWQNFTGYHKFGSRNRIMEVFDLIDTSVPVSAMVGCTKTVYPENWRYYAVKYAGEITVAYRSTDYGYLYFQRAEKQNSFDPNASSLDVCILQSGYFSATNVAWKMLNRLVELLSQEKYYIYLDNHGGSPIILSRISNEVRLDIEIDGWHLYGVSSDVLQDLGIAHTIVGTPSDEGDNDINQQANTVNCLCYHNNGSDYVEEAIALLDKLSIKYPDMLVVK